MNRLNEEKMRLLIQRKRELEEGIIPFVEPGTFTEEMAFDEWFFIKSQIGLLVREAKSCVII